MLFRGTGKALPFADQPFDIVPAHYVFEHLADSMVVAREAWQGSSPRSMIFIEVSHQFAGNMFHRDMRLGPVSRSLILWFFRSLTLGLLPEEAAIAWVAVSDFVDGQQTRWRTSPDVLRRLVGRLRCAGEFSNARGWKAQ